MSCDSHITFQFCVDPNTIWWNMGFFTNRKWESLSPLLTVSDLLSEWGIAISRKIYKGFQPLINYLATPIHALWSTMCGRELIRKIYQIQISLQDSIVIWHTYDGHIKSSPSSSNLALYDYLKSSEFVFEDGENVMSKSFQF